MQKMNKQNSYSGLENNKILSGISKKHNSEAFNNKTAILSSFNAGLYGFAIVISIIILTKLLAFSVGTKEIFELNINDVIFSFWGFLVLSFSRFVTYYKK